MRDDSLRMVPFGDDDELLAGLAAVLEPEPAQPTHAEMAAMFQALDSRRDVAPAAVVGVRRGLRWVVLAGAAAAVVVMLAAVVAEAPRRPSHVAARPTTTTVSPNIDAAGHALVSLEQALATTDVPRIATSAAQARTALDRLTSEERAAFEPRATNLLTAADERTGAAGGTSGETATTTAPEATTTTTAPVPTTTAKPAPTTTTTARPPTTTTSIDDHHDDHSGDSTTSTTSTTEH